MLAGVNTLHYLEHMFNDICFNGESWFTTFSTALDLAFGVQEVMQPVLALGFHSASWWQDQSRRMKDGMQSSINTLAGFPWMTLLLLVLQSFHKEQHGSGLFEKDSLCSNSHCDVWSARGVGLGKKHGCRATGPTALQSGLCVPELIWRGAFLSSSTY